MSSATSSTEIYLMTMAGMLVQILYQLYAVFARSQRSSSSKEGNKLAVIGLVPLVGYYIGIYLLPHARISGRCLLRQPHRAQIELPPEESKQDKPPP